MIISITKMKGKLIMNNPKEEMKYLLSTFATMMSRMITGMRRDALDHISYRLIEVFVPPDIRRRYHRKQSE